MALGFFRRRQKMVVIIMAVLMVTFLVGMQGFQMIFSTTPDTERVLGKTEDEEITEGDLDSARREMEQLAQYVGLGAPLQTPHHEAYWMIRRNGPNLRLAYCLLLREAARSGVEVSRSEVDSFLLGVGLVDELYANHIADIRERGMTEDQFRSLIARWLAVYKTYAATTVQTPPPPPETNRLYRDLLEQIDLRVVRIEAEDMLGHVPEQVPDKKIEAQYRHYATKLPGQTTSVDTFGFGYMVPHRVRIGYLLIDEEPIARAARPRDTVIEDYWVEHEDEFTKEVPIAPPGAASKPTTRPATGPASATTRPATRTVTKTLAEATDEIIELLRAGQVRQRVESVTNRVDSARAELASGGDSGNLETYRRLLERMLLPADGILGRTIKTTFTAKPLDQAVAELARAARLTGISYPWGEHGPYTLDKGVKVSLDASGGMTLAAALERITAQAFAAPQDEDTDKDTDGDKKDKDTDGDEKDKDTSGDEKDKPKPDRAAGPPTLRWALCRGLEGMLFCRGGDIDMFPIRVGSTDLVDRADLAAHAVLAGATTSRRGGVRLANLAFMVKAFGVDPKFAVVEVGKDGKRMYVPRGRVIWRLLQADAAHEPITQDAKASEYPAELRERVVEDIRLERAFDLAVKRASRLEARARDDGLAAVAGAEQLEMTQTGLFSRRRAIPLQGTVARLVGQARIEGVDVASLPPFLHPWNRIESVRLPTRRITAEFPALGALDRRLPIPGYLDYVLLGRCATNMYGQAFMRTAFSLMPRNLEKRGPDKPAAVTLFFLRSRKEVYVLERTDHKPLVAADLQDEDLYGYVAGQLLVNRRWQGMMQWFAARSIVARTGFQRVQPEDS